MWNTTSDGFSKARTKAFQSLLQSKISDLNDCYANDTSLAFLTKSYGALTDTQVKRGEFEAMWDIGTGGYLRIYAASGGGHREGTDLSESDEYIDFTTPGGRRRNYTTSISVVFHPDCFNQCIPDDQAQIREDAYTTALDWLIFDVIGLRSTIKLSVPSDCFDTGTGHDFHYDTKIANAGKLFIATGNGGATTVIGVQATITGYT